MTAVIRIAGKGVIGGAKWRPLKGALLDRALDTGEFPSDETREYLARANRNSIAIIGIESVPAIQNLEAILEVPGIDAVFVGPNDLAQSMRGKDNKPPSGEAMAEALQHVLKTCK